MSLRAALLFAGAFGVLSCRAAATTARAMPSSSSPVLPDIPGFASGPEERSGGYFRRSYARQAETTAVTLAHFPMSAEQYQDWLRMSTADFPQADLALGSNDGNGFYQCAADDPSRCNLLLQLRCGLHIEIRGQGIARRADADAILRGLALPALAASCRADAVE